MGAIAVQSLDYQSPRRGPVALSDEALLLDYANRENRESFERLLRRFDREILAYLRRYLGNEELAEDALQGTFLSLHRNRSQFDPQRKLRPWLYRIATNQANDLLRRNRRHKAISLETVVNGRANGRNESSLGGTLVQQRLSPPETIEFAELRQQVASAIDQLPERLKQPILLVIYQGLKYREAAARIGIPMGTLKSRLSQAVQRLATSLERPDLATPSTESHRPRARRRGCP